MKYILYALFMVLFFVIIWPSNWKASAAKTGEKVLISDIPDQASSILLKGVDELLVTPSIGENVKSSATDRRTMALLALETSAVYRLSNSQFLAFNPLIDTVFFMDTNAKAPTSFDIIHAEELLGSLGYRCVACAASSDKTQEQLDFFGNALRETRPEKIIDIIRNRPIPRDAINRVIAINLAVFAIQASKRLQHRCTPYVSDYFFKTAVIDIKKGVGSQSSYDPSRLNLIMWFNEGQKTVFTFSDTKGAGYWTHLLVDTSNTRCNLEKIFVVFAK